MPGRFHVSESGTRWVMNKKKPMPKRPSTRENSISEKLAPFMNENEANGDLKLAVILAVRNLLAPPGYWCHSRAESRGGTPVEPDSVEAARWSIIGAVFYVTHPLFTRKQRTEVVDLIRRAMGAEDHRLGLFKWEELPTTRHSQIIALLNRATSMRKDDLGYAKR